MSIICLDEMEFYAYHGCFKEEQVIGNRFIVNLEIEVDTTQAECSDKLGDTVNYQAVYEVVREVMTDKCYLLERLGRCILDALNARFPEINRAKLRVSKMNPPLGGKMRAVTIELLHPARSRDSSFGDSN